MKLIIVDYRNLEITEIIETRTIDGVCFKKNYKEAFKNKKSC